MLLDIVRFEWRYHTRQISFPLGLAIFAFLGCFLTIGLGNRDLNANSPYLIVEVTALLSLMSIFPLTVFCASAILRDREHGMEEIVFATSVEKSRFLAGRFTGALLASFTLMLAAMAAMMLVPLAGLADADRIGPFVASHYAEAFAIIVVPDVLFVSALVFAIAALTRSAPATWVGSVVLYALYFVAAALTNSPIMAASSATAGTSMTAAALLDPFGLTAFFEQTRYWTALERDTRMVAFAGNLLANRLAWTGAALAILAVVFRAYPFRLVAESRKRGATRQESATRPPARHEPVVPSPNVVLQLASATWLETRLLVSNLPFLVLLVVLVVFAVPETWSSITSGEYGAAFLPATSHVISRLRTPLAVIGTLAMIFWSAEAFWRERSTRIEPIVSATPVGGPVLFASKLIALAVLSGIFGLVAVAAGVGVQLVRGGAAIEPGVYLGFLLLSVTSLVLFAAASGVIHVLSPGKYVGMLVSFALAAFVERPDLVGVEHRMLRFASAPPVGHSDMNGFGENVAAFVWFSGYWALVVATLALAAGILWRRHDDERLVSRLRSLISTATRKQRVALATLATAALATAVTIFVNTNVLSRYETADETLEWKAAYEREWGDRAADPQPRIAAVETKVDIDPDALSLRLSGTYRLTNESDRRIPRVMVSVRRDTSKVALALDGRPATSVDERFGMHSFELSQPLPPGESIALEFDIEYAPRGFTTDGVDSFVSKNGTFVMGFLAFPGVGYRTSYEIRDEDERSRRGLPPRGHGGELSEELGGEDAAPDQWVTFDATVSTKAGQIAVAPGRLERSWEEDGRVLFHYRAEAPIPNVVAFVSARYDVTRETHAGVEVEIYSHPGHESAVPAILETARASLDTFNAAFGAYPHKTLRLAEVPSSASFAGFATPGLVLLAENRVFRVDTGREAPVDLVCRRVAHEIAHQWWGHGVVPAPVDGGVVLTESLTKYAEALVLERMRGGEQVVNLRRFELDRYLSGRVGEEEPPLFRTGRQPFLFYSKGLLVLGAIEDLVGPAELSTAIRGLVEAESGPGGDATTLDLLDQLYAVSDPGERALIDEWMKEVVLHDLAVESATATKMPDNRYRVTVRVRAAKVRLVAGQEEPLAMDELIGIAVHGSAGEPILSEKRRIRTGTNEFELVVPSRPDSIEIDPDILRIDRDRLDNVWRLETK